jgi:DNA invertase Pin-like site-specific DNA recombinase
VVVVEAGGVDTGGEQRVTLQLDGLGSVALDTRMEPTSMGFLPCHVYGGDQLVVTKLDRLGRSLEHLIELAKLLQGRGVDLVVLDQGIDTSTAIGRLFFQIIGAIAEFEHALMSERTVDGLAAARARGRTGGQKPKLGPRQVMLARQMYDETGQNGKRKHTVAQIAAEFGVSRPTIHRHLAKTPG